MAADVGKKLLQEVEEVGLDEVSTDGQPNLRLTLTTVADPRVYTTQT